MALVLAWLAGTAASTAVAWTAVGVVTSQVTERPVSPLSDRALAEALAGPQVVPEPPPDAAPPVEVDDGPPASVPRAPDPGPSTVAPGAGRKGEPPPAVAPTTAPARVGQPGTSGAPEARSDAAAPPSPPPTTTTTTAPPSAVTKTIEGRGGAVAVRYESGKVSLLWARPNPGFTMDVKEDGPEEVEVRFRSEAQETRIEAWWDGEPRHRVEERDSGEE